MLLPLWTNGITMGHSKSFEGLGAVEVLHSIMHARLRAVEVLHSIMHARLRAVEASPSTFTTTICHRTVCMA